MKSEEHIEKFQHKKSLGQHFLNSPVVPRWLCDAAVEGGDKKAVGGGADFKDSETILEIGPGTGALTRELLERGARVVALEADVRAVAELEAAFPDEISFGNFVLHHTDARTLDLAQFDLTDHSFSVVANIPYYLSGHLFRNLLESPIQPTHLTFLVQKEVAERIARDKKESLLSLSVKAYGTPSYYKTVKRGHFTPPPAVDSAIIHIANISRDRFNVASEDVFFTFLHQAFAAKRKQLLSNLKPHYSAETLDKIKAVLEQHNLPETVRAEDITIDIWFSLVAVV